MVNMDSQPAIQVLLDNFLLPFCLDCEAENCCKSPVFLPDNTFDPELLRKWSTTHGISLIYLPPKSHDLNPFDVVWPHLLKCISHIPIFSAKKLFEELADWFDSSSRLKSLWYTASRSMNIRLLQVLESNGNWISY